MKRGKQGKRMRAWLRIAALALMLALLLLVAGGQGLHFVYQGY